jgi:hypothetical protein
MATRSTIAMENPDGSVTSIYCHWDGDPKNNGRILLEQYSDPEKVKALIALGSLSSLGDQVAPPEDTAHSFDSPIPGVTVAYRRDRGDMMRQGKHKEVASFFNSDFQKYGYLFTQEGEWLVKSWRGEMPVPVAYVLSGVEKI